MIIKNVSVYDEGKYRVMVVWKQGGDDSAYVHLTAIVPSSREAPEIDRCNDIEICRLCIYGSVVLECSLDGRPAVDLTWYNITSGIPLDNHTHWITKPVSSFPRFISYSRIELHLEYLEVTEIGCVPSGPAVTLPGSDVGNASVLLITPSDPYKNFNDTAFFHVSNVSKVIGNNNYNTVAWLKQTSNVAFSYKMPTCKALGWSENGTLSLHANNSDFEGIYTQVVKNDGKTFERSVYEVHQAIAPEQSNFFEECLSQDPQNCSIYVNGTGTLTCSVTDSTPAGAITWNVTQPGPQIIQVSSFHSCENERGLCKSSVTISFRFTSAQAGVGEFGCLVNGPWKEFPLFTVVKVFNNQSVEEPISPWTTLPKYNSIQHTSPCTHSEETATKDIVPGKSCPTTTNASDDRKEEKKTNWAACITVPFVIGLVVLVVVIISCNSSRFWKIYKRASFSTKVPSITTGDHPDTSKNEVENEISV